MNTLSIIHLYADGGVIGKNPSPIGGTYAYRILDASEQHILVEHADVIPANFTNPFITNNLTEMLAIIAALPHISPDADVHIFSDSQITLGRLFQGWKWKNIPLWLHARYQAQRQRLPKFHSYQYTLLSGHPTQAHLATGIGKRGYPVSIHNAWCDHACTQAAKSYTALQPTN